MFTDMVGYTALGQKNESLALSLVEEQRKLLRPIFSKYEGREVKTMGDAFLVEFPSALNAVKCAYEIQKSVREFNSPLPKERRIHLRVGVHVGDIVWSQGDVSGDAVNVASRIESLADDGGVCLTRQVYDHVQNKFELPLRSLGSKLLKNVRTPLEVYRMEMPWEEKRSGPKTQPDRKRIAVLPFTNISPDPADEYFADGMTEEIISTLSRISGLRVIARTSMMTYKASKKKTDEIAGDLGVGSLLEGGVRKVGDRLRITVQLIDAQTSDHLWSEGYDRDLKDVLALQSDISKTVAEALRIRLLSREAVALERRQAVVPEAYALYLKGRFQWNERTEEGVSKAIRYFEQAIKADPNFAPAYSGLADCYSIHGFYGYRRPNDVFPMAKELAMTALRLDEHLAEAYASLSEVSTHYTFDWTGADFELKKAIELNPGYAMAHAWRGYDYLAAQGRFEEALAETTKAVELDPLSGIATAILGKVLYLARRNDEAIEQYKKSLEIEPGFAIAHEGLAYAYSQKSMLAEALAEADQAVQQSKGRVFTLTASGYVKAVFGRREEALEVLRDLNNRSSEIYVPQYDRAILYTGLGDKDQAVKHLEQAYDERGVPTWLKVEPIFDPLRSDCRFLSILRKTGLA